MGKRLIIIIIQGSVNFQFGEFDDGARGGGEETRCFPIIFTISFLIWNHHNLSL